MTDLSSKIRRALEERDFSEFRSLHGMQKAHKGLFMEAITGVLDQAKERNDLDLLEHTLLAGQHVVENSSACFGIQAFAQILRTNASYAETLRLALREAEKAHGQTESVGQKSQTFQDVSADDLPGDASTEDSSSIAERIFSHVAELHARRQSIALSETWTKQPLSFSLPYQRSKTLLLLQITQKLLQAGCGTSCAHEVGDKLLKLLSPKRDEFAI